MLTLYTVQSCAVLCCVLSQIFLVVLLGYQKGASKLSTGTWYTVYIEAIIIIIDLCLNYSCDAGAVSSLHVEVSSGGGTVIDGSLLVCPDTTVSLTCSHDSTSDLTRWEISAPIGCDTIALHSTNPSDALCGSFTINMVSAMNQPTRMSTLVLCWQLISH